VLLTETDGRVNWPSSRDFNFRDTRVISAWAIYANGELWDLLKWCAIAPQAARIFLTNALSKPKTGRSRHARLGLVIGRQVDGGLHEDFEITKTIAKNQFVSTWRSRCAPISPTFRGERATISWRRGHIVTSWSAKREILRVTYRNRGFCRELNRTYRRGRRQANGIRQRNV